MSTVRTMYIKKNKRFWTFFLFFQDRVKTFLIEIHNHSRHTFCQYSKEGEDAKMAQVV